MNLAEYYILKAQEEIEKKHYAKAKQYFEEAKKQYMQAKIESLELQKVYLKVVYDVLLDTEFVSEEILLLTGKKLFDCFRESVNEMNDLLKANHNSSKETLEAINSLIDLFLKLDNEVFRSEFSKMNFHLDRSNKEMEENLKRIEEDNIHIAKFYAYIPFTSIEKAKEIAIEIHDKSCQRLKKIVDQIQMSKSKVQMNVK